MLSPEEQGSLKPAELVIKMWKGHDRAQKVEEWDGYRQQKNAEHQALGDMPF